MKRSLSVLFAVLMTASLCSTGLTGCATTFTKGRHISELEISSFKKGVATYDEVLAQLGKPDNVMTSVDTITVSYSYVRAKSEHTNFIPIVGAFVRRDDQFGVQSVQFLFNRKTKILQDVFQTASGTAVEYNVKD